MRVFLQHGQQHSASDCIRKNRQFPVSTIEQARQNKTSSKTTISILTARTANVHAGRQPLPPIDTI